MPFSSRNSNFGTFYIFLRETYEEHEVIRKGNRGEGVRTGHPPVRTGQPPVRRGQTSVRRVFFVDIFYQRILLSIAKRMALVLLLTPNFLKIRLI